MTVEGAGRVVIWPGLQWAGVVMDSGSKRGNVECSEIAVMGRGSPCVCLGVSGMVGKGELFYL